MPAERAFDNVPSAWWRVRSPVTCTEWGTTLVLMSHGFRTLPRLLLILGTRRGLRRQVGCSSAPVILERMSMKVTRKLLNDLLRGESASGMLEYVLLAALLVLAAYVALHHLDKKIAKDYNQIGKKF